MNSSQQSQARTRVFARVIGPYLVIVAATAVARSSSMRTLLSQFYANSVWPWVTGVFVLLGGLIVVALHQYWRGAAAIIVSILGWMTALKGLSLLAFPHTFSSVLDSAGWWRTTMVILGLVGLYLTYVGWSQAAADDK